MGCSKCRFSAGGCTRCRNPNFKGATAPQKQQPRKKRCQSSDETKVVNRRPRPCPGGATACSAHAVTHNTPREGVCEALGQSQRIHPTTVEHTGQGASHGLANTRAIHLGSQRTVTDSSNVAGNVHLALPGASQADGQQTQAITDAETRKTTFLQQLQSRMRAAPRAESNVLTQRTPLDADNTQLYICSQGIPQGSPTGMQSDNSALMASHPHYPGASTPRRLQPQSPSPPSEAAAAGVQRLLGQVTPGSGSSGRRQRIRLRPPARQVSPGITSGLTTGTSGSLDQVHQVRCAVEAELLP